MVSRELIEAYRNNSDKVADACLADLDDFFKRLRGKSADEIRDAMLDYYPNLVRRYGAAQAQLSLMYYAEVKAEAGVKNKFKAIPAETKAAEEMAEARVRSAAKHLYPEDEGAEPDVDKFSKALVSSIEKFIRGVGHDTITHNGHRDQWQPRFALIPHAGACIYCIQRAGHGAFFYNEESIKRSLSFHGGRCRCVIAPVKSPDEFPRGYDPQKLVKLYDRMAAENEKHAANPLDD